MINPFNFRIPVDQEERLAGRAAELDLLGQQFDLVGSGRPSHLLIEAPELRGKTSVLNVAAAQARSQSLIPVRLALSPAHFDDNSAFFRALILALDSAIQTQITVEGAETIEGSLPDPPRFQSLTESAFIPGLFESDLERATNFAGKVGKRGLAFLIDDSQHFSYADYTTLQALDVLLRQHSAQIFIFAGDMGTVDLFYEHSYSLGQRMEVVELGLLAPGDVRKIILGNDDNLPETTEISRATAYDLWLLARQGEPYWLMVIANLVWEMRDPHSFNLTPALIKDVTNRQAEAMPGLFDLEDAVRRIDEVTDLPENLLGQASRLAPYEAMTVSECVLAQRCQIMRNGDLPSTSYAEDLEATEELLTELVTRGLMEKEEDRFRVAGDAAFKLFLRYEAPAREGSSSVGSAEGHGRYGSAAAPAWVERLARESDEVKEAETSLLATYMASTDADVEPEKVSRPFDAVQAAADEGNPVALAAAGFRPVFITSLRKEYDFSRDRKLAYVGIVFGVGLDESFSFESERIACGWLRWAESDAKNAEFAGGVQRWLEEHEDELKEYRLQPLRVVAGVLDRDLTDRTVALMSPFTVPGVVISLFKSGKLRLAASYLKQVIDAFELGRESSQTPWTYRAAIVDAYIRLGFIAALIRHADDAANALRRGLELYREIGSGLTDQLMLAQYNLAYAWALKGQFAKAAELANGIENPVENETPGVYLLLFLPTPSNWTPPSELWNTTSVEWSNVAPVIRSQARVFEALAGGFDHREFVAIIADEPRPVAGIARAYGWTLISRFDDFAAAAAEFAVALEMASDAERPHVEKELEFARAASR